MSFEITSSAAFEQPGAPARDNKGPMHAPGLHDDLALPNGSTVGQTDNETLRQQLLKLNIPGAATEGRHIICQRYSETLRKIFNDAGSKAVDVWLQSNRG
jgi:hypothetical protein